VLKRTVARGPNGFVVLVDSITQLSADDAGAVVISGSHGGSSSGEVALQFALAAVLFNDAGVGKDRAGIAALDMLQARGRPAGAIAHTSGRIGDAQDMWEHGVISHANEAAQRVGLVTSVAVRSAVTALITAAIRRA